MVVYRIDNRFRRCECRIDLRAGGHSPLRFLRMVEQFLWKLHCPGNIRYPPIEFAVDKIGAAPKEQSNRRCDDEIVAEVHPRDFMSMGVVQREKQQAEHAAMARHAAFPDA